MGAAGVRDRATQEVGAAKKDQAKGRDATIESLVVGMISREDAMRALQEATRGKTSSQPKQHALPYWRLPERLYDDPEELAVWARKAFAIAERKKLTARKPTKQKARKRRT